eukprot:TRINITY_DN3361_c0_g1_i3.p1 TRINITY_DN3361_c0_g1~~TRINITY_DN3361_c0_g1_i3.p1  ORF type:complete len:350 (-),score=133.48 TRINITY_DN3361_c0_g1_i3:50-1099(-)
MVISASRRARCSSSWKPKTYKLAAQSQPTVPGKVKETNKVMLLQHGTSQMAFRMEYVSNSACTPSEFNKWIGEMRRAGKHIMTRDEVPERAKQLRNARSYRLTEEDIQQIVERKQKGRAPVNLAAQKARLIGLREAAKDRDDDEEYQQLGEELSKLEDMARAQKEKAAAAQAHNVNNINLKNRTQNFNTAFASSARADGPVASDTDPFSRRRTLPKIYVRSASSKDDDEHDSSNGHPASGDSASPAAPHPAPSPAASRTPSTPHTPAAPVTSSSSSSSKSLASSGDQLAGKLFKGANDIDLDIDLATPSTSSTPKEPRAPRPVAASPAAPEAPRATMSLLDYKRRRGVL